MAIDPVCMMKVDGRKTSHKTTHMGEKYYFCSQGCMRKFEKDPERYIKLKDTGGMEIQKPEATEKEKKPWWKFW